MAHPLSLQRRPPRLKAVGIRRLVPLSVRENLVPPTENQDHWYQMGTSIPGFWSDKIEIQQLDGKGRGVIARQDVYPGQLLIVSQPVALVRSNMGSVPEFQDLLEHIWGRQMSRSEQRSVLSLYGAGSSDIPDFNKEWSEELREGAVARLEEAGITAEQLVDLTALNAFGDEFPDLPAAMARNDIPDGLLGLWPEFSFLNHSCVATAINKVIGSCMVVRACRAVPAGGEITINYLGRNGLLPVRQRQAELQEGYQFVCGCDRCRLELQHAHVGQAVEAATQTIGEQLGPQLQAVLAGGVPPKEVGRLQQALRALVQDVDSAVGAVESGSSLTAQHSNWLRASAFDAYSMLLSSLEHGSDPAADEALLERLLGMATATCRLSDLHFYLSLKALSWAQTSRGVEASRAQLEAAAEVTAQRYGLSRDDTAQKMMLFGAKALDMISM